MNDVIIIIQARMGSSRLPGKMMLPINGIPLFEFIIQRIIGLQKLGATIVLATSNDAINNPLVNIASRYNIDFFRGSEVDVFSRFMGIQSQFPDKSYMVRICGDNPFIDSILVEELVHFIKSDTELDYVWNNVPRGQYQWPDGFGAECFSVRAILAAADYDLTLSNREHVTQIFYTENNNFSSDSYHSSYESSNVPKMDIDSSEDYEAIIDLITKHDFSIETTALEIIKTFNEGRDNSN
jgi:spore coat polysaccharide biosynthesis protein SpsF